LEPEKVRALSNFYREEFQRHLDQLHASGAAAEQAAMERMCRRFLKDLDDLVWRSDFKTVAENLLKSFDTLTGLSRIEPPRSH
jgi:hypothetical protein